MTWPGSTSAWPGECGANAARVVVGVAAGADSINDIGLLRHGAMGALFDGVRAPSTLGSFLRSFTWGNVRQAERAGRELLMRLAGQVPLLPGADAVAFVDIDSTQSASTGTISRARGSAARRYRANRCWCGA